MKKLLLFIGTTMLIAACGKRTASPPPIENEQKTVVKNSTKVDPNNRQDTVYYGYILGQSTKENTIKLIKDGELKSKSLVSRNYTISMGGFSNSIKVKGYPFDLYIGDKKFDALLSLYDTNGDLIEDDGVLMSLRIYINGGALDTPDIINALKDQYGEQTTPPKGGYSVDVPQELDAFWNISNKAVYLESFSGFLVLVYEDIIAVRAKNKAEEAAEASEKAKNLEKSKKTHL